jgi:WD40 repeat protein
VGGDDLFIAPGEGGEIGGIDMRSGIAAWQPTRDRIGIAATSADGRTGIAQMFSGKGDRRMFLIFRAGETGVDEIAETEYGTDAFALAVTSAGTRVALSGSWGSVSTRFTADGAKLPKPDGSDIGYTHGLTWHGADPKKLIGIFNRFGRRGMASAQEWIVSWNTDTGERITAERNKTPMNCVVAEPGGDRFAEAGDDKVVRIRDANTLAVLRSFRAHDGPINAIAWHPRRAVIATGSADRTVRLWDIESGRLIEQMHVSLREPQALYFSPSGNRLACAIPGEKTLVWDFSDLFLEPLPPAGRLANRSDSEGGD